MTTSEYGVIFYKEGGHNHDGINSTKINTTQYSVFDFTFSPVDNEDGNLNTYRLNNYEIWKQFIVNTVNNSLLDPAGIVIGENAISSENIIAGSISAEKLESDLVLVDQVIKSTNYGAGGSGWAIYSNGFAEFGNVVTRGNITVTSGSINLGNGAFSVLSNGRMTSTSGNIAGWSITTSTLSSGNVFLSSNTTSNARVIYAGSSNAAAAPFSVRSNGFVFANAGNIGGWTITNGQISAGFTSLYSNGVITARSAALDDSSLINGNSNQFIAYANGAISSVLGSIGGLGISTSSLAANGVTVSSSGQISALSNNRGVLISPGETSIQMKVNNATVGSILASNPDFGGTQLTFESGSMYFKNVDYFTIDANPTVTVFTVNLPVNANSTNYLVSVGNQLHTVGSRKELKDNIVSLDSGLDKIKALNPVSFNSKINQNESHVAKYLNNLNKRYGFIVQDIELVDKSLLNYDYIGSNTKMTLEDFDDPSNFAAVNYDSNAIIALLTKAVQELAAEIDFLKQKMEMTDGA